MRFILVIWLRSCKQGIVSIRLFNAHEGIKNHFREGKEALKDNSRFLHRIAYYVTRDVLLVTII